MRRLLLLVALASLVAYGCAETPQQRARRLEPMLSAAGFHMRPPNTSAQEQRSNSTPALRMHYYFREGEPFYWFADPYVCHCIYVGDEADYQKYQQLKIRQQLVQREMAAAEMRESAAQQEQFNFMMWPGAAFFW